MIYAKLIHGILYPAMPVFVPGEKFIYKPTEEQLLAAGYFPVQYTAKPEVQTGYKRTFKWVEKDGAIVQEWTVQKVKRNPTAYEIARSMVIQTADDNTALRMKKFYPTFDEIVGQEVKQGFRFRHGDKLWATVKALTIQKHYPPGEGMESLYTKVNETHSGTIDDAIPYNGNMTLEKGKYYTQDEIIYHCYWDTGIPVYNPLAELVGLYVKEI